VLPSLNKVFIIIIIKAELLHKQEALAHLRTFALKSSQAQIFKKKLLLQLGIDQLMQERQKVK